MSRIYLSPPDVRPADYAAVRSVMDSNWVAPAGPHLAAFEAAVSARCGGGYAVALASGTAALHLALQILEIGPGDRVICPTLTFAASANPIRYCGAEPVFVDSERRTWNMDPDLLSAALDESVKMGRPVKAVIVVHLYGQCAEMEPIERICREHGVALVEDAAEALGASYHGRPAGSFGEISFLSFNGNKIITTSGGGMLLTPRRDRARRALYLATQAREPVAHYEHLAVGYNYRMSNLLAGLGHAQLEDLDRRIAARRAHFEAYRDAFSGLPGLAMMPVAEPAAANYWLSCILIDAGKSGWGRDALIAALEARDIEARPIWKPLHLQPVFKDYPVYGGAVAERLFEDGVCLPSGSSMGAEDRERVIAVVRELAQNGSPKLRPGASS